jgi:hypothetical protein
MKSAEFIKKHPKYENIINQILCATKIYTEQEALIGISDLIDQ